MRATITTVLAFAAAGSLGFLSYSGAPAAEPAADEAYTLIHEPGSQYSYSVYATGAEACRKAAAKIAVFEEWSLTRRFLCVSESSGRVFALDCAKGGCETAGHR